MADNGRVHPDCVNASNPYHECGVACLEKIAQGHGRKEVKKSGSFILGASRSFGRKKKGSESQPRSSKNNNSLSPRSPLSAKKKVESENSHSSSSSRQHSEEAILGYHSFDKGQGRSTEFVHPSGNLVPPNGTKSLSLGSFTCFAIVPPNNLEDDEKLVDSPEEASSPIAKNLEVANEPTAKSLNFTFSGISRASEESDSEIQSVISDSCVSVGKYHVRSNAASVLQLILDKYGDVAANCRLESTSLRAYYLECLCSVVQELQSTSLNQLTKSKVKEYFAVLKDVESAQIDVSWLRSILNGLTEAMELDKQQQSAEEAKINCNHIIESTRKELESMMEDLAKREKAVADAKALIEESKTRLRELELESSGLSDTILSISSKVEKFHTKPLGDKIL